MKKIYVFGNGNLSWEDFHRLYLEPLHTIEISECEFLIGDFRGTDVMMMEFLKNKTAKVTILHVGERPRYFADTFNTQAGNWKKIGGFRSDGERDQQGIAMCTHFLAIDFNSDEKRISGTQKNIKKCLALQKIRL